MSSHWFDDVRAREEKAKSMLAENLARRNAGQGRMPADRGGAFLWCCDGIDTPETRVFHADYKISMRDCTIALHDFEVGVNFRGKGIGLMGLKAILPVVYEQDMNRLYLRWLRDDGVSFFASMGALPNDISLVTTLGESIQRHFIASQEKLLQHDSHMLRFMIRAANNNPIRAWRHLSQTNIRVGENGPLFKAAVFGDYKHIGMSFMLGDPSTQDIVFAKLGECADYAPHRKGASAVLDALNAG